MSSEDVLLPAGIKVSVMAILTLYDVSADSKG